MGYNFSSPGLMLHISGHDTKSDSVSIYVGASSDISWKFNGHKDPSPMLASFLIVYSRLILEPMSIVSFKSITTRVP